MIKLCGAAAELLICGVLFVAADSFASDWQLIGPEGGSARSLAYDPGNPKHILLGTSTGQLFTSSDGGDSWELQTHFGPAEDYVIDHIVFDPTRPTTVYAAGWGLFHDTEGDVFRSDDSGRTWRTLKGAHGKSIRAFAMAPSDHNTLVIGALDGVFRSRDGGTTWKRMTPEDPPVMENHSSMKNFVSVAVDPQDPDIVYAGTRHLAWKTTDGGLHWRNTAEGMQDDSDVFSIIVDSKTPSLVYAGACSGIYESDNAAEMFHRVEGLPSTAMRTRVLKQDHERPSIIYAGTTGGLWKTLDGGAKWSLVSSADVVVNDVLIDPRFPDRILLATDLQGVLASDDGFAHYTTSNRGFSLRVVGGLVVDREDPDRLFVGVANDSKMGGVFISANAGKTWWQSNRGLVDRNILSLQQGSDGALFAGTNDGIFYLASQDGSWQPASMIWGTVPQLRSKQEAADPRRRVFMSGTRNPAEPASPEIIAPRVRSLEIGEEASFAATSEGLFISMDHGRKWYGRSVEGERDFIAVNVYEGGTLTLVGYKGVYLSRDWGRTWSSIDIPIQIGNVYNLTLVPDSSLWLGTSAGALQSTDDGKTWRNRHGGLPEKDVLAVRYDGRGRRLLATALHEPAVFESEDNGETWQKTPDALDSILWAINYEGRLLAVSSDNGLFLEQSGEPAANEIGVSTSGTADSPK